MGKNRWWLLVGLPAALLALTMVVDWPLRQVRTEPRQEALFTVDDVPHDIVINHERNSLDMTLQIGNFVRSAEIVGPDFKNMTTEQIKQVYASQMNIWILEYNALIPGSDVKNSSAVPTQ